MLTHAELVQDNKRLRDELATANARADAYLATIHRMQRELERLRAECVPERGESQDA